MSTPQSRQRRMSVIHWCLGGATVLAVSCWANMPYWSQYPVTSVQDVLISVAFAATGAALHGDPHQQSNSGLFWVAAALYVAGGVGGHDGGPWALIEFLARTVTLLPLIAVLLRYPEPRIQQIHERGYVIGSSIALTLLRLAEIATSKPDDFGYSTSAWWISIWPGFSGATVVGDARTVAESLCTFTVVPLIVRRVRRTAALERRILQPVKVATVALGLVAGIDTLADILPELRPFLVVTIMQGVALLAVPAAFLIAAVQRRLSYAAVGELVRTLSRPVTIDRIRSALRATLSDPDLEVVYWLPEAARYFDTEGKAFDPDMLSKDRCPAAVTGSDGAPLALVVVDASMRRYPHLLEATLGAAALALENGRLQAELRAQLIDVHESRARLVEASDTARRRIERDLHDGAQQRLVALKLALAVARTSARTTTEVQLIDRTREQLQAAIDELRALARGIHPAVLTEGGLAVAIDSLVERLPLPVEVDVPSRRWPPAVESAAYFVACESLANAIKHSGAQHGIVTLTETAASIVLQIADDGAGGAQAKPGGGLEGLQDRVLAAGGSLLVISPPGEGTEVITELPVNH